MTKPHKPIIDSASVARVRHEANRAPCAARGDLSQPGWAEAPDWLKKSAMSGVTDIVLNPGRAPEECHRKWMDDKKADGWSHGATKDSDAKTHPCPFPYGDLPPAQRVKDHVFVSIVGAIGEVYEIVE